jgi:hypothetical protein
VKELRQISLGCFGQGQGRIREIPGEILQLERLEYLNLYGQPIETPPPEIVEQGVDAIKNYWRGQKGVGVDYLRDAKRFKDDRNLAREAAGPRQVFVSYSWVPESDAVVDEIEKALADQGIRLLRDRNEIKYRAGIREFMQDLGHDKAVIVVLSKAYLESKSCMFELTEIAERGDLRGRVFPIIMPDAKIYNAADRLRYVKFWEEQKQELEHAMRQVGLENLQGIREELDLFAKIRGTVAGLVDILGDMNALTLEQHKRTNFADLVRALNDPAYSSTRTNSAIT